MAWQLSIWTLMYLPTMPHTCMQNPCLQDLLTQITLFNLLFVMDRNINVKYPRYDEYDHCSVEEYNGTQFSLILKCHLLDVPFRPLLHRKPKNRCDFASKADSEVFLIVVVLSRSSTWSSVQCSKEEANLRLFDYLHFILSTLRTQRDYFEENVTVLVFT